MSKKTKKPKKPKVNNLVAKYCREFNKATVERDRTKYNRKEKHKEKHNRTDYAFFCPLISYFSLTSDL